MESWVQIVSQTGFPIAISIYLLIKLEKRLEHAGDKLSELANAVAELAKTWGNCTNCPLRHTQEMHIDRKVIEHISGGE